MNDLDHSSQSLFQMNTIKGLSRILCINIKGCTDTTYLSQLDTIFSDLLNVYHLYSEKILFCLNAQGPVDVNVETFDAMRSVKTEILELFIACLEVCHDTEGGDVMFKTNFMPNIMSEILTDYHTSPPCARDSKVLSLFSTAVCSLKDLLTPDIPRIMDALFQKTLEMITTNMLDYPEHRINFFKFLHDANTHFHDALLQYFQSSQQILVFAIVWGIKHTERNISETSLDLLYELLQNISTNPAIAQPFYATFMLSVIQDIFSILTDRLHKSGFKQHASILKHLFHITAQGQLQPPLDNDSFLKQYLSNLSMCTFPSLTNEQSQKLAAEWVELSSTEDDRFSSSLRDTVIWECFVDEDNSNLEQLHSYHIKKNFALATER